jgi:hypothetical protein
MDRSQARHAKAMAAKIAIHITGMRGSINYMLDRDVSLEELMTLPSHMLVAKFNELEYHWNKIQSVLTDMLPALEESPEQIDKVWFDGKGEPDGQDRSS